MIQLRWVRCARVALVGAVLLMAGLTVRGATPVEELTKRLPDGVIAVVGTSGGEALTGDFEKTSLGRIVNDPGVRSFCEAIKTQVLAKAQEKGTGPNEVKQMEMIAGMAELVASRPLVVGVAPLPGPVQIKEKPPVYGFLILDAGAQQAKIEGLVKQLEALAGAESIVDVEVGSAKMRGPKGEKDLPLYWGWLGDYLVVAANDAAGAALQYVQKPRGAVPAYFQKVPVGGDALVVHADLQKVINLATGAARQQNAQMADTVRAVLKELGLAGVRTLTLRAGFAGPDVVLGSLLEVPEPRTGLLTTLKPIDPAVMDMVDARAVTAGAANLDLAGAFDMILHAVKTASAAAGANVEKGLAAFESQTKLNIRNDLLGSLAGPAVFYTLGAGAVAEAPLGGAVALLKLKDAALFEKTMTGLGDFAAAQSKGQFQAGVQKRDDGRTVHTWMIPQLAMMQVTPTWSVGNGYAVIGSNPGVHDTAVKLMAATGTERKSIRDTPGYKEATAKLPNNLICLNYADSRTQYTQMMTMAQQFWPMASMFAAQAGVKLPAMLPSLGPIIKDMKPSLQTRWLDSEGLHMQYQGPGLEVSLSGVAGAAVGMGVALPAMAKAREQARNAASMSHLKQIGLGLITYANDHQGNWPADLEQAKSYWPDSRVLESPREPKDFAGPGYIYLPGQPKTPNPRNVVVYENPGYCTDRINVSFADGHVESMKPDAFRSALKETCERLGKPVPEIKFKGEGEGGAQPRPPRPPRPQRSTQA
jgi:prepilin-type processing-associated H-X9-DG protein